MSWRIGIASGACLDRPIDTVLPAIAAAGAEGVEISTPPAHFNPGQRAAIESVSVSLRTLHLAAISVHAPFGGNCDLASPDAHARSQAIASVLTAAAALKALGGGIVVVHPSDLPRQHEDVKARLSDAVHSLTQVCEEFAREGVTLAIESALPHLVGGHPNDLAVMLRALPPNVGVCLDTGHTTLGGHWHRFVEVAGTRLIHVHASDNHGSRDDHLPPGEGRIDWADIAHTLHAARFGGWVMLELGCPGALPLDEYFRAALRRTRALLDGGTADATFC